VRERGGRRAGGASRRRFDGADQSLPFLDLEAGNAMRRTTASRSSAMPPSKFDDGGTTALRWFVTARRELDGAWKLSTDQELE
jgi:hypothetical protein